MAIAAAAAFAYGYVLNSIVVQGNGTATVRNITASQELFAVGIFAWVFILLLDLLVAWGLCEYFKSTDRNLSVITAMLRVIYSGFLAAAISNLILALIDSNGDEYVRIDLSEIQAHVMPSIVAFYSVWSAGLIVFGIHLLALGLLVLASTDAPKVIGYLLLAAAFSYLAVHLSYWLLPKNYNDQIAVVEMFLSVPMAVGELAFGVWLLWRSKTP